MNFSAPDWFSDMDQDQQAVVDVWFGGKRIGDARVTFRPGSLTFGAVHSGSSRGNSSITCKTGWRMPGGAFWAPGSDLIDRRKMIGAGVETQTDTRVDRDSLRGDPVIVFLPQRSRVDVLREG